MSFCAIITLVVAAWFGDAASKQRPNEKTIRIEDYVLWQCEQDTASVSKIPYEQRSVECWRLVRHSFAENAKFASKEVRLVATQDVSTLAQWRYASAAFQYAFPSSVDAAAVRGLYPTTVPAEIKDAPGVGLIGLSPDGRLVAGFRAAFGPCAMVPLSFRVTEVGTSRVIMDKSLKPALDGLTFSGFGGFVQDRNVLAFFIDGETILALQRDGSVQPIQGMNGIKGLFAAPDGQTVLCHESGQRSGHAEALTLRSSDLSQALWSRPLAEILPTDDLMLLDYLLWSADSRLLLVVSLDSESDEWDRVALVAIDARTGATIATRSMNIEIDPERSAFAIVCGDATFDPFRAFSIEPRSVRR